MQETIEPLEEKPPSPFQLEEMLKAEGTNDLSMSLGNHIEEFRERLLFAGVVVILLCLVSFGYSKDLVEVLKSPIAEQGVKFIQSNPSEFFFTTIKVSGYSGILLAAPVILNQIIAYVVPGLSSDEKKIFGPLVLGASILFYIGLGFGFTVLGPAALNFFLNFAESTVESFFSIDQYADFVGFMMLSTGVAFQVPIIQTLLAKLGVVNSEQMFAAWRYVVVGAIIVAGFLTPSTDPLTQCLLAGPLIGLYLGGASFVRLTEGQS
jgi:sec-independent protein translocase protein TatC